MSEGHKPDLMAGADTLLLETNPISLRTAVVLEQKGITSLVLMPPNLDSSIPGAVDYTKFDHIWLYRRKQSLLREFILRQSFLDIEQDVRPMAFKRMPEMSLLWADSGQSVALYLNQEPWAFICEGKNRGYSKGILRPSIANPWDQALFEKTFSEEDQGN